MHSQTQIKQNNLVSNLPKTVNENFLSVTLCTYGSYMYMVQLITYATVCVNILTLEHVNAGLRVISHGVHEDER